MKILRRLFSRFAPDPTALLPFVIFSPGVVGGATLLPPPPRSVVRGRIVGATLLALTLLLAAVITAPAQAQEADCPDGQRRVTRTAGGSGVSACHTEAHAKIADDCVAAGWGLRADPANPFPFENFIAFELVCHIPTTTPAIAGINPSFCEIMDLDRGALCTEVYGDPPVFPTKSVDFDGRPFVGQCSNDGAIPAGIPDINRNGEQECACDPATHAGAHPNCVETPAAIRDAVNKCAQMGWTVSVDNGGKCEIPTHSVEMTMDYAECHFDNDAPKCADIFGAEFAFPRKPASGDPRYVFNCDPDGTAGLAPTTANLTGAESCGCNPDSPLHYALDYAYERDNFCISRENVGADSNPALALSQEKICRALFGKVEAESVCSEVDANDTLCILDSKEAFPCRGLFKHILTCNADYNRRALNPFFCGEKCGDLQALGRNCLQEEFRTETMAAGWADARRWCAAAAESLAAERAAAGKDNVEGEILLQPATGDGVFWCKALPPRGAPDKAQGCRVGEFGADTYAYPVVGGLTSASIVNNNIIPCSADFNVCGEDRDYIPSDYPTYASLPADVRAIVGRTTETFRTSWKFTVQQRRPIGSDLLTESAEADDAVLDAAVLAAVHGVKLTTGGNNGAHALSGRTNLVVAQVVAMGRYPANGQARIVAVRAINAAVDNGTILSLAQGYLDPLVAMVQEGKIRTVDHDRNPLTPCR